MKTLKRTRNQDGSQEVLEYSHIEIIESTSPHASHTLIDEDGDWTGEATTLRAAKKDAAEMTWVETSDENWAACQ
jgi:hypothetical protein